MGHPANLGTVLNCVVNNELGQFRSHSNMALISMMLYTWPDETAKVHVRGKCFRSTPQTLRVYYSGDVGTEIRANSKE